MYAENLNVPSTSTVGQAEVEWFVEFRGKKPSNYGYDPVSGSIIITPMTSFDLVPYLNGPSDSESVLADVRAGCDGSGNLVISSTTDGEIAYLNNIETSE